VIGIMMKLDFERAVLNRIPHIEANSDRHYRQVLFLCDEYQHFATVGKAIPPATKNSILKPTSGIIREEFHPSVLLSQ